MMCETDVQVDAGNVPSGSMEENLHMLFPTSTEVCGTTANSALNSFNPLGESEPNLDLYEQHDAMTDENGTFTGLTKTQMTADAKTKKWMVLICKLSMEEVDILSGPKMLPNLAVPIPEEIEQLATVQEHPHMSDEM